MTTQPSILFLFSDHLRGVWLDCRDDNPDAKTPTLDFLAASGTYFINALTPSHLCSPVRICRAFNTMSRLNLYTEKTTVILV